MSRGTFFVVFYSVVLLGLFLLSCYLMSIVDPKPLESPSAPGSKDLLDDTRRGFKVDVYPNEDAGEDGALGYGLEKASEEEKTAKPRHYSKIIPLYRELLRTGGFVNSSLVRNVVPPFIPSLHRLSTTTEKPMYFMKKPNSNTSTLNTLTAKYPSAKGFRRSVNEIETNSLKEEENSGVILKIIDDSGRSRIEIKLGPNGSFEGNKLRHYRSSGDKLKTDNNVKANDNVLWDEHEPTAKNTIIKILPNNTMVFEGIDHSLVSLNVVKEKTLDYNEDDNPKDINSSITGNRSISAHKNEANFEEIILLVKSDLPKNDSSDVSPMIDAEMYSLKMLIDNETRSINQLIKNTDNVNNTFNKQESVLNFDEIGNITDFNKTQSFFDNEKSWLTRNYSETAKPINLVDSNDFKDIQVLNDLKVL